MGTTIWSLLKKVGGGESKDAREHLIHHPSMPRTEEQTSKMSVQLTVWMQGMLFLKEPFILQSLT